MSNYTFTFKKGDIFVEFVTTDKAIVERQFNIWVECASTYAREHVQKIVKEKTEMPAQVKTEVKSIDQEKSLAQRRAEHVVQSGQKQEVVEEKIKAQHEASVEAKSEDKSEVFEQASSLLKTINSIQNPVEEETPQETVNFDEVLEKSIENPTFEPAKVKDQVFLNFIRSKNTRDKFHYLIITAYYLSEFEKLERFSLKQVNAKLMQNLSEIVDHTTLQDAINQNFIELVPDLTGISDIAEYRLTDAGEEFFVNQI